MKNKKDKMNRKNYLFSITPGRGKKKKIPLRAEGSMSLAEFDQLIRKTMNYDWDHLSGFYMGKPFRSPEIATITPDGGGDNSDISIDELSLSIGSEMGYVYDFGDDIQSVIRVEDLTILG